MAFTRLSIPDVVLFEPKVFGDSRGFFFESFNQQQFNEIVGENITFVQDNHSKSAQGVLRGLHYQIQQAQGKLVRVCAGEVLDVAVDLRRHSPTFGNGWQNVYRVIIFVKCGFRLGLRMASWYCLKPLNFYIKPQIIGRHNMNVVYGGMIQS